MLNQIEIPCGPVLSTGDLVDDPHMKQRGMVVSVPHPQRGSFLNLGCPILMSDSSVEVTQPPLLGEHSEQVLDELLGYTATEIADLKQQGVI